MRGTVLIVNGTADHVHMLVRIRPVQAAAEIDRVVKTNSSRWAKEKWNMQFAWQTGYGAFSVSESNVSAVSRYIAAQEEHYKRWTFQEEYVTFLKKDKIAYDEAVYLALASFAPLGPSAFFANPPTARAVGCILAPLRGYTPVPMPGT